MTPERLAEIKAMVCADKYSPAMELLDEITRLQSQLKSALEFITMCNYNTDHRNPHLQFLCIKCSAKECLKGIQQNPEEK